MITTTTHGLMIIDILQKYFHNKNDATQIVSELEMVIDDKLQHEKSGLATKSDLDALEGRVSHSIAEVRGEMGAKISDVKGEVSALDKRISLELATNKSEVKQEFYAVRSEMKIEFAAVRSEMKEEFAAVRSEMKHEFASVRIDMEKIRSEMYQIKSDTLRWVFGFFVTLALMIVGLYLKK